MKRIPLTQGQYAIVDDEDYEWLSQWKWHAYWNRHTRSYYAVRNSRHGRHRYKIYMSRQIMGLTYKDGKIIDHRNHNTIDNRMANLRVVSQQENVWNIGKPKKGYQKRRDKESYCARIIVNKRYIGLGEYPSAKQAHNVYAEAKAKYHGVVIGKSEEN